MPETEFLMLLIAAVPAASVSYWPFVVLGCSVAFVVVAICCGAIVTHSVMVPHPGPLAMVDNLRVDAGQSLLWGIVAGVLPCALGYFFARWIKPAQNRSQSGLRSEDCQMLTGMLIESPSTCVR